MAAIGDLLFRTKNCLLQVDGDVLAEIWPTLRARAATTTAPSKQIAETEELDKDVAEVLEHCRIETGRAAGRPSYSGVPEAVIHAALFHISQHRVSFAALFELFLRVRIVR